MTTDTVPKTASAASPSPWRPAPHRLSRRGRSPSPAWPRARPMIAPHMATMLAFIATDAAVEAGYLQQALRGGRGQLQHDRRGRGHVHQRHHPPAGQRRRLAGRGAPLDGSQPECAAFEAALRHVCLRLAQAMARDGEGATKFVEVRVAGAPPASRTPAWSRARSPAPTCSRRPCSGPTPTGGASPAPPGTPAPRSIRTRLDVTIGDVRVVRDGLALPCTTRRRRRRDARPEVRFAVDLNLGDGAATAWGCDLTPEYVRLNSDYTT